MGVRGWRGRLLLDQYDFSLDTFSATFSATADALESSNWQSSARQYQPDAAKSELTVTGYYTGAAAGTIYTEIRSRLGTESPAWVAWLLNTAALGNPAYVLRSSWGNNVTIDTPVDEMLKFDATFQGAGAGGLTLLDGTITATGNGSVIDFTTAGSAGGMAYLVVRSITGTATNASVSVQSSATSGMASPTTHGALTFSAVGVQELVITGAIGRYCRVVINSLGGATAFAASLVLCVNDVTM